MEAPVIGYLFLIFFVGINGLGLMQEAEKAGCRAALRTDRDTDEVARQYRNRVGIAYFGVVTVLGLGVFANAMH